jgi:bacillithiol system protein YtxJ
MNWLSLTSEADLHQAIAASHTHSVLLFKHSTRCSISHAALSRIENAWNAEAINDTMPYYLDLLNHRDISNLIAQTFGVTHQSPQILIIKNGKCTHHASHMEITFDDVKEHL